MGTVHFHIDQMGLFNRVIFLPIKLISQNNLTHIRSFPDDSRLVKLDSMLLRNVNAVTFIATKCTMYLGMYIMTYLFFKKIIKDYFSFIT